MIRRAIIGKKDQIVSEYLTGTDSFAALSEKYGVNARTIQTWVRAFRKQEPEAELTSVQEQETDINTLKKRLKQAELKNVLLEEMLRLSEEHTGINLRKKFGSKP